MINDRQEQAIIDEVTASQIKNESLKNDLIDHICCLVEANLNKGMEFEDALKVSVLQIAPGGLNEIEKETIFLLNYNKIMMMKRLMYLSGYLFSVSWVTGVVLKMLHLMGAGVLMTTGAFGLAFIFIPLLLMNRYKYLAGEVLSERMKWILGAVSMAFLIAAITMKFMHFMGAGILLVVGAFVFGFGFLPFLFFRMYKRSVEEV